MQVIEPVVEEEQTTVADEEQLLEEQAEEEEEQEEEQEPEEIEEPEIFPYFVEPATGLKYPIESELFLGLEAMWNHHNYWVIEIKVICIILIKI